MAAKAMHEPYGRVLTMPWDEVMRAVADEQELQAEDGDGALRQLLQEVLGALLRG